jgi:hypothetical protein
MFILHNVNLISIAFIKVIHFFIYFHLKTKTIIVEYFYCDDVIIIS